MTDEPKTGKLEPVAWASDTALALVARGDPGRLWPRYSVGSPHPLYGPEAAARIEELEAQIGRWSNVAGLEAADCDDWQARALAAEARLETAVKALEPFAAVHQPVSGMPDSIEVRLDASFKLQNRDAMCTHPPMTVTVGDIRRAKAALAQPKDIS